PGFPTRRLYHDLRLQSLRPPSACRRTNDDRPLHYCLRWSSSWCMPHRQSRHHRQYDGRRSKMLECTRLRLSEKLLQQELFFWTSFISSCSGLVANSAERRPCPEIESLPYEKSPSNSTCRPQKRDQGLEKDTPDSRPRATKNLGS